jgi:RNA-directed DNA polymerase
LPIGNLTSQYFANHYLSGFDHFMKEKIECKAYVRYMDDMIFWSNKSSDLKNTLVKACRYIEDELNLSLKVMIQNTTGHGVSFVGYRLFRTHIELNARSKKRFIGKINAYQQYLDDELWSQSDFQRHVLPLVAFTEHASSKGFRMKVFDSTG